MTRVTPENGESVGDAPPGVDQQVFPGLSDDQWATLLNMLNQNKGSSERLFVKKTLLIG